MSLRGIRGTHLNRQIYEEAAAWFVEMRVGDVDPAARRAFDAWVRKSPEHLRAYLELSDIWDDAKQVSPDRTGSAQELVERACEAPADWIAIRHQQREAGRKPIVGPRGLPFALAAGLAGLAMSLAAYIAYQHYRYPSYTTGIGEQRTLVLDDGSRVELNARTRLRVRYMRQERDIDLLAGEAVFHVSKNALRPFIVQSGQVAVRAVGTAFDVDRKQSATTVTVLEGRVSVQDTSTLPQPSLEAVGKPAPMAFAPLLIDAGEQVTASAHHALKASKANLSAATAWTHGSLVFDDSRLADVIEEFNRHNARQLLLDDPKLSEMRISGVYATTDPALLVRFLREQPGVQVEETDSAVLIRAR